MFLLYILYCLTDKHETPEEAGEELGSRTWEPELNFDSACKVELTPEMTELRKPSPNRNHFENNARGEVVEESKAVGMRLVTKILTFSYN